MALLLVLLTFAFLLIFVLGVPHRLWSYYKLCKLIKSIPGWPTHWLYGNLHQKASGRLTYMDDYVKWVSVNKHPISKEWLGPLIVQINVNHPDLVKEVLNAPKAPWVYQALEPWLGQGLLLAEGKHWSRNRRLLTKAFHFEVLKPYIQVYNDCTDVLVEKWFDSSDKLEPVQVHADMSKLTLDILLRCSFSFISNCQLEENQLPYIMAVRSLSEMVIDRYYSIFLSALSNWMYLNFTPLGRSFKRNLQIVHEYADKVIRERRSSLDYSKEMSQTEVLHTAMKSRQYLDFLDILLTARDEDGIGLTNLEIRNEVDTFMFEGHDTTAHALSWTLYCLAKYPEHQERCREEANEVLGSRAHLEYDDLSKLSYIHWCIKESLRLYPPVYSSYKQFSKDTRLGDYIIPKQCLIAQKQYAIHHNPEFWKDPYTFNPLRFHPDNDKNRHPYSYIPFSAGPRNCIGQIFAMNEERVVLTTIVRKFRLSLVQEHDVVMVAKVLLTMQNDIKLWVEPI